MSVNNKVEYLVVDTSAFIQNVPLQEFGTNIVTEENVITEIKNKRQLRRLVVLPYELAVKDAFSENVQFVTEFAKKTGDYTSLSATDIKVIALTYQLEKEHVGTAHLKNAPSVPRTIDTTQGKPLEHPKSIAGFYLPGNDQENEYDDEDNEVKEREEEEDENEEKAITTVEQKYEEEGLNQKEKTKSEESSSSNSSDSEDESDYLTAVSDVDQEDSNSLASKFKNLNCNADQLELEGEHKVDDILAPVQHEIEYNDDSGDGGSEEDDEDSDEGGWITPSNVAKAKKSMDSDIVVDKPSTVACMTTDFAMQNVLMQIGLNVAALDGRVIKQLRTFIFRCYACFKTTSIMTKVFCPSCGLKTLKKVAVSLDDEGKQRIHINLRRPLSAKGKKFSLPTPKGGKHAINPILCEDQPIPDQRPTRLARMKNDPLNDDYIAGYSPFVMRDVNSKSAMLGIRPGSGVKYWMKKNPNEPRRKRK